MDLVARVEERVFLETDAGVKQRVPDVEIDLVRRGQRMPGLPNQHVAAGFSPQQAGSTQVGAKSLK